MNSPKHVGIVGCGFAGTSALWQLIDRRPVSHITVFESTGDFGPGYPYREDDSEDYLINNTTDAMCLVTSNRGAFLEWLRANGHPGAADPRGHLPRRNFGLFLRDVVRACLVSAAVKGVRVELVSKEVLSMSEAADGSVRLDWQGGTTTVDAALLTTGRCPEVNPVSEPPPGAAARYLANHIREDQLDRLPLDAQVHVLGASLSAYDIVNRLFSSKTGCSFVQEGDGLLFVPGGNERRVVLASRSGRLKKMQSLTPTAIKRSKLVDAELARLAERNSGLTLNDVVSLVDQEAQSHGVRLDWPALLEPYSDCQDAQAVNARAGAELQRDIAAAKGPPGSNFMVDLVLDAKTLLWDAFARRWLRPQEQTFYRHHVESALLCYGAPCPIPTAQRLLALHRAGRLVVRQGVRDVALDVTGEYFSVPHRHGVDRAEVVVNATGAVDRRLHSRRQGPLVVSLREQGLLQPFVLAGAEADGVAVDMSTFKADGARNIYVANMFLWGPGFFTSSAFMMAYVVEQAIAAMYPSSTQHSQSERRQ